MLEVELVCSNPAEHRARVEGRATDIPGLPMWRTSSSGSTSRGIAATLVVDTAAATAAECVALILRHITRP